MDAMDARIALGIVAVLGVGLAVTTALRRRAMRSDKKRRRTESNPLPISAMPTRILNPLSAPPSASEDDGPDWLTQAADALHTPLTVLRSQAEFLQRHAGDLPRATMETIAGQLIFHLEQVESVLQGWRGPEGAGAQPWELRALMQEVVTEVQRTGLAPLRIASGAPVWLEMPPASLAHALTILLRQSTQLTTAPVELRLGWATLRGRQWLGVDIVDRRPPRLESLAAMWTALELDLARTLLEDVQGRVTVEHLATGARTTLWLPATAVAHAGRDQRPA
jgi:hypothetical protein